MTSWVLLVRQKPSSETTVSRHLRDVTELVSGTAGTQICDGKVLAVLEPVESDPYSKENRNSRFGDFCLFVLSLILAQL